MKLYVLVGVPQRIYTNFLMFLVGSPYGFILFYFVFGRGPLIDLYVFFVFGGSPPMDLHSFLMLLVGDPQYGFIKLF